jgi:soluble lytic murein transglycosylase-like protein
MARLRTVIIAAASLWAAPAAADPMDRWSAHIAEASGTFGIPEAWIRRVMRAESGGRTTLAGQPIVSRAGAMGLMQLMPGTWSEMRAALGLGRDPHQPRDNILAGTAYLRRMYDRFGYPGLLAAYNAGPARYARHLSTGLGLPAETVAYVANVAGGRRDVAAGSGAVASAAPEPAAPAVRAPALFAVLAPRPDPPSPSVYEPRDSLFVPLSQPRR